MRRLLALTACGAFGMLALACVSGVTPDCSDAATPCGPGSDASGDVLEAQPLPEASRADAASSPDPDAEGPEAGDLDAGDEV